MDKIRKYATATAFRKALEDRLKAISAKEKLDLQRLLREVSFDRLLARLFTGNIPWVLKGGYALELRMKQARVTKDIDLVLRDSMGKERGQPLKEALLDTLTVAAGQDLQDFFSFVVGPAMQDLDAAPYGGARFPVETILDGRTFVKFHIDIGAGDVILSPIETTEGRDWLGFAGIPAPKFPTISQEQHFAEKVHAYTVPRKTPNSRARDLIDMVLLIQSGKMDAAKVKKALAATFERRKTHTLPERLEPPPAAWQKLYSQLADQCGISESLEEAFGLLNSYLKSI